MFGFSAINSNDYVSPAIYCSGPDDFYDSNHYCATCNLACYQTGGVSCKGTATTGINN